MTEGRTYARRMRAITYLLMSFAVALLVGGFIIGLVPITVGDTSGFRNDGFSCGSALFTNDDLTDLGHEVCEMQGGGAGRRLQSIAMISMGVVFFVIGIAAGSEVSNHEARSKQIPQ